MKCLYLRSLVFSAFVLFLISFSSSLSAANRHVVIDQPRSPAVVQGKDVTFRWSYKKDVSITKIDLYTSAGHRTVPPSETQYTWLGFPYGYGWWYLKIYKDNSKSNWARTEPVQFHHQFPTNWERVDWKKDINYSVKYLSDGRIEFLELQRNYRIFLHDYFDDKSKLPYGDRWRRAKMYSQAVLLPRSSWDFIELFGGSLIIKKGYRWDSASFPCKSLGSGSCIDDDANIRSSLVHDALYDLMRMYYLDPAKSGYRPNGRFNRMMADMMHYMIAIEDGQPNKDFFTYWPLRGNGALGDYYTLQDVGMGATHADDRLNDWKFHVSELTATTSGNEVKLTWQARNHSKCEGRANSMCEPESHRALTPPLEYDVVRYDQPVPSRDRSHTVLNIKTKEFPETAFADETGAPGSTYWYRIERVSSGGDNYDDYSNMVKVTLEEANKAPLVDAGPDRTIYEGDTFSSSGSFADPGSSTWTATVDYDDGSGVQPLPLTGKTFNLSHNYFEDGLYSVTVTVTDEHSALGTDTALVLVKAINVPPVVDAGTDDVVNEGGVFRSSGSFTDSDSSEWSAAVDYGDGSIDQPLTLTGKTFELRHIYADDGIYTVTVEVIDDDSGVGADTTQVTVNNLAPIAGIDSVDQPNPHFILPVVHMLNFNGSFSDPGWLDTHEAVWDFGEGMVEAESLAGENAPPDSTGSTTSQHAYSAPGVYTATLRIVDDDGDAGTDTVAVYVVTPQEAIAAINNSIEDLPGFAFRNNSDYRKRAFSNRLDEVINLINAGADRDAAKTLRHAIRAKTDGVGNDWIMDKGAQKELCAMIDDLIAHLAVERPKRILDCDRLSADHTRCRLIF